MDRSESGSRKRLGRWTWRSLGLLCALAVGGCGDGGERLNVLLLTVDTTRADRFGFAGFEAASTPNFDAFAAHRATVFENAITAAPITFPSHTTILTGTFPAYHGVHDNDGYFLDDKVTTLAEILGEKGWATAAVIAAYPLDSQVNLDQGFDSYDDDFQADWTTDEVRARTPLSFGFLERDSGRVNRAVERWLGDRPSGPFFLWAHYFDPHQPYSPPPPYDSQYSSSLYDGEIAFMDESFGELLGLLDAAGELERTIVVVVGDHGESLGQHGEPTHANYLYDASMKVPLLIAAPRLRDVGGRRVTRQARTVDVAPTLLELLGLPVPEEMQGQSLVPALRGEETSAEPALLESYYPRFHYGWAPLRALREDRWKLLQAPQLELYDLQADPGELYNLAAREPERLAEMEEKLFRMARRVGAVDSGRSTARQVDSETREKLMALGYLGGGVTTEERAAPFPSPAELAEMPNPVEKSLVLGYVNFSYELLRNRRFEEALPVLRNGLEMDPNNYRLRVNRARALAAIGLFQPALEACAIARQLQPESPETYALEGRIHLAQRDYAQAVESLQESVRRGPQEVENLKLLAATFAALGDNEEAIAHFELVLELDERNWSAEVDLADAYLRVGEVEDARVHFERALRLNPYSAAVRYRIAVFYRVAGDRDFSRRMLQGVLQVDPGHAGANMQLAELMLEAGEDAAAVRPFLEAVRAAAPGSSLAERAAVLLGESP